MKDSSANHHNYYNKTLQPFAGKLRREMTKAEACLWKYALRARMMKGYQFRRQRPVLNFIADFMCQELMLVIETDGLTHDWEETVVKDRHKDEMLANAGFRVIRFDDEDVLNNINGVIREIEGVIDEIIEARNPPPTPASGGQS